MNWTSTVKYIDIETGEQLTKNQAIGKNSKYIIIKTTKHGKFNYQQGKGHTEYTKQCRKNPQTKIEYTD